MRGKIFFMKEFSELISVPFDAFLVQTVKLNKDSAVGKVKKNEKIFFLKILD